MCLGSRPRVLNRATEQNANILKPGSEGRSRGTKPLSLRVYVGFGVRVIIGCYTDPSTGKKALEEVALVRFKVKGLGLRV